MQAISKKIISICFTGLILVTCTSCKADTAYKISSYLNDLALASGIGVNENIEDNFKSLLNWGVIDKEDETILQDNLDYGYLIKTTSRLLDDEKDYLFTHKIIDKDVNYKDLVNEDEAKQIIDKVVEIINHKQFEQRCEYKLSDKVKELSDNLDAGDIYYDQESDTYLQLDEMHNASLADIDDVYDYVDIAGSADINFDDAIITPYGVLEDDTSYVNNMYNLLAYSTNHVFNTDGFRVSYQFRSNGIHIHVSKRENQLNFFGDLSIRNVKISFKYTSEDKSLKNCYFNVKMDTTEQIGVNVGKYDRYYLDFKDLDGDSFMSKVKSMFKTKSDELEAIIPICKVSLPLSGIPTANLNMEVVIKIYASGRVELLLTNGHDIGFEVKDGNFRTFYNHEDDFDAIARANGRANAGINISLDALSVRLCDVELDGGLKAELKTTVHLYDKDGNMNSSQSDYTYSMLEELAKENPDVWICGDVSFYWNMDLMFNTYRTKLHKYGFFKTIHIMDDDNQVFGNLHHIENGQFVKKCTRKSKSKTSSITTLNISSANKIILDSYAEVIVKGDSYQIIVNSLPTGYSQQDVRYSSANSDVACVEDGLVTGLNTGSTKIEVYTSDKKYTSYVHILVSTG